jgi:outer membrane protein insertion porin family
MIRFMIVAMMISGCTGLKFVPEDEKLYTGADVTVNSSAEKKYRKAAKKEAEDIIRPKPNSKLMGSRPGVWWYYKTRDSKKGLKKMLRKRLGEKPVYLSDADPGLVAKAIDARLYNHGYFDAYTVYEIETKKKTASVKYFVEVNQPYLIKEIVYPKGNDTLSKHIAALQEKSLIKTGVPYNLDVCIDERKRIDGILKDSGYFYFKDDYLIFKIDSSPGGRNIRIVLEVKPNIPVPAKEVYVVKEVKVFAEYELGKARDSEKRVIDGVSYYSKIDYIRPAPVIESVFLKNGKTYSRKDHNLTITRLNGLGVYKFVNVKVTKADSGIGANTLKAIIQLTPLPKKSVSMEVQGVTKSNNFVGPGINFSFRNRNALGGAELLSFNVLSSFETQLNGPYKGQFSYEFNPKMEFFVPRLITPFFINMGGCMFVPKTKFSLDFSYLSRVNYYNINSVKFGFGYVWQQSLTINHDLKLVNINYYNIYNESNAFQALLNENPTLQRRYEKQLIAGIAYSFFYNEQVLPEKRHPIYFNTNIEFSGNTIAGINKLQGKEPTVEDPLTVLGVKYSQFARLDIDIRKTFRFDRENKRMIATRMIAGWALPYGNSSTIPFIKQFFSGGAYSLRGFPVYSVGPGTYNPPDSLKNLYFVQQGGEIKLEGNIEYRYSINRIIKTALFADAGNIWLNNENVDIPGGKFNPRTFVKEFAASIGTGLRFDFQFFVFRLDLGVPVRKPWLPDGERWVFKQIDFSSPEWRRNNLILNIAFGYPF